MLVEGTVTIAGNRGDGTKVQQRAAAATDRNIKPVIFKNCAEFTDSKKQKLHFSSRKCP